MHTPKIHCAHKEIVRISALKPHPKNNNKHPEDQIAMLARILRYQGWRLPIKVSLLSGFVTSGHGRLMAAKLNHEKFPEEGWDLVPVDYQEYESEAQEYADITADNAIAAWAELDLGAVNMELENLGPDFDLELLGIEDFALEPAEKFEAQCDEDEVPEQVDTRVKLGDIWQLGRHRLMCGDSTSIDAVEKLMGGCRATAVFTDPPYNIGYEPVRGTHEAIANDEMDAESFKDFLRSVVSCLLAVTEDNSFAVVWSGWSTIDQFAPVLREAYEIKAMPVWIKHHFGMGWYARPKYEPFFLCLRGAPPRPEPAPADVWEHARVMDKVHSCEKPVGLIIDILGAYSTGDHILDLFGGSGSTLIACEKTNRTCFMSELDPHYVTVIITRWMKYTGQMAYLIEDSSGKLNEPVPYAEIDSFRGEITQHDNRSFAQNTVGPSEDHTGPKSV